LDFVVIACINQLRKRATLAKLELETNHQLHDAGVSRSAHRPKSIDVIYRPVRIPVQVCDGWIRQALEVDRVVDVAELRVIEHVEGVGTQLEPCPFTDREALLER
jgi:hypothetical protein